MKTGYRNGITPRSAAQRLADHITVDPETGCHIWHGALSSVGYGQIQEKINGVWKFRGAHVVAFEGANGAVPDGLVVDHLCRNRRCCNPQHLEAVTFSENVLRGDGPTAQNARKTHCPAGHPYSPGNTRRAGKGGRRCATCARAQDATHRAKKRSATDEPK